jgi:hypothetical protein
MMREYNIGCSFSVVRSNACIARIYQSYTIDLSRGEKHVMMRFLLRSFPSYRPVTVQIGFVRSKTHSQINEHAPTNEGLPSLYPA